jgi:hypothetical protein
VGDDRQLEALMHLLSLFERRHIEPDDRASECFVDSILIAFALYKNPKNLDPWLVSIVAFTFSLMIYRTSAFLFNQGETACVDPGNGSDRHSL